MRKTAVSIVISLTLLAGCATVPSDPPTVLAVCPRIPALPPLDPETQAALETDFTATIQRLLSGLRPLATEYGLHSSPAAPTTGGLRKP